MWYTVVNNVDKKLNHNVDSLVSMNYKDFHYQGESFITFNSIRKVQ